MHEAFAKFLNEEHGADGITAEQVFLVTSKRKAFRSTDAYRVGVKGAQAQAKVQAAEAKENAKAERAAAQKAEKEQAAAAAAPVEKKAPAAKPATKKTTATKAATPVKTA
jgi:hypothetical protein